MARDAHDTGGALKVSLKANIAGMVSGGKLLTHGLRTFQWKDIEEGKRPESPLAEYLLHSVLIKPEVLAWRWAGLGFDAEIQRMFLEPGLPRLRAQAQMQLAMGAELPDITAPETLKHLAVLDYWATRELYKRVEGKLLCDVTTEAVTVIDRETGDLLTIDRERPLRPGEERSLAAARATYRDEMQLLTGQATTIIGARDLDLGDEKKEQAARELAEWRKEQTKKLGPQTVSPEIIPEGEIVPTRALLPVSTRQ